MNKNYKNLRVMYGTIVMTLSLSLLNYSIHEKREMNQNRIIIDADVELQNANSKLVEINSFLNNVEESIVTSSDILENNESNDLLDESNTISSELHENMENETEKIELIEDNRKLVALTFDDGPSQYTEELINLLSKYDAKATFFVLKRYCEKYPDALSSLSDNGHEIAIHGVNHTSFNKLSVDAVADEISTTLEYIEELNLSPSPLVRPPYMAYNQNLLSHTDYPFILWNIDTRDWESHDANKIKTQILNNISDGSIILMHDRKDTYEFDSKALEDILSTLSEEYKFVTVSELCEKYETALEAGKIYKYIKNPKENKK